MEKKKTVNGRVYGYLSLVAIACLGVGGWTGAYITDQKLEVANQQLLAQQARADELVKQQQNTASGVQQQLTTALAEKKEIQDSLQSAQQRVKELEAQNKKLNSQLQQKNTQLRVETQKAQHLQTKTVQQADALANSRETILREEKAKQALAELKASQETLQQRLPKLKEACAIYLDGRSWDAKSDSCDKQKQAQAQLKSIAQKIEQQQKELQK